MHSTALALDFLLHVDIGFIFSVSFLDFGYFLLTAEERYFVIPLFSHLIPCAYIFLRALLVKRCIREDFCLLFLMYLLSWISSKYV